MEDLDNAIQGFVKVGAAEVAWSTLLQDKLKKKVERATAEVRKKLETEKDYGLQEELERKASHARATFMGQVSQERKRWVIANQEEFSKREDDHGPLIRSYASLKDQHETHGLLKVGSAFPTLEDVKLAVAEYCTVAGKRTQRYIGKKGEGAQKFWAMMDEKRQKVSAENEELLQMLEKNLGLLKQNGTSGKEHFIGLHDPLFRISFRLVEKILETKPSGDKVFGYAWECQDLTLLPDSPFKDEEREVYYSHSQVLPNVLAMVEEDKAVLPDKVTTKRVLTETYFNDVEPTEKFMNDLFTKAKECVLEARSQKKKRKLNVKEKLAPPPPISNV